MSMLNDLSGRLTTKADHSRSDAGRSQRMRSGRLTQVSDGIRQPGCILQAKGQGFESSVLSSSLIRLTISLTWAA
jgi:hypothetical protein